MVKNEREGSDGRTAINSCIPAVQTCSLIERVIDFCHVYICQLPGLSGLAIGLISSALFLVLAVTCGAVFFKAGGSSCRRKSNPRTLTSEINTTEQTAPLTETKAVERNSFRMESKL